MKKMCRDKIIKKQADTEERNEYRPIRGGHEKPSFRLGGGGGRLQNAPSANAFL